MFSRTFFTSQAMVTFENVNWSNFENWFISFLTLPTTHFTFRSGLPDTSQAINARLVNRDFARDLPARASLRNLAVNESRCRDVHDHDVGRWRTSPLTRHTMAFRKRKLTTDLHSLFTHGEQKVKEEERSVRVLVLGFPWKRGRRSIRVTSRSFFFFRSASEHTGFAVACGTTGRFHSLSLFIFYSLTAVT